MVRLGSSKTKAEPAADGTYKISGTKIFISAGEHDLTENIIHIVLARLPDAPAGTRGISLFIVPKFIPTADGGVGERVIPYLVVQSNTKWVSVLQQLLY